MTMAELERSLGFGNGTIRRWSNNSPSVDKVLLVADLLNADISWLLKGKTTAIEPILKKYYSLSDIDKDKVNIFMDIALLSNNNSTIIDKPKVEENNYTSKKKIYNHKHYKPSFEPSKEENIPYIGTVAAGKPNLSYYDAPEYISSPVDCDFAMRANGDSMYPVIHNDDYIFVKSTPFLENGEVGIITVDGETTCKKFYIDNNKMTLLSFNPEYAPIEYDINEFSDIRILGKVILTPDQESRL